MSSQTIELSLPAPHPGQLAVIQQSKRFNVVCCGRRWGKTVLGMDRLIHLALEGKPVAWFSPSYKLLADTWRELRSRLAPVTRDKSEQEKRIELITGGVIDLWSLDSPDAARGRKYAGVVVDEAAMIPALEEAWQQSIRPTLTDLAGEAWFLSTPKGMNYFKVLYDCGQDPTRGDWASWQMATSANPFLDPAEIEAARLDMTEAAFNQEYLALFVNWEGSVFRRVSEAATGVSSGEPDARHEYIIGCDWGRSNDYTVFVVLDATAHAVVELDRSHRVDYALQCGRLRALRDRWRPEEIIAEHNSIGQPIIEQLTRDGIRVQPFTTTNASKAKAIEALALAFERGDIGILNDPVLVGELVAYQAERLPSGLVRYGAPSGQHDDCVMALAMAWTAISSQDRAIYPIRNSEITIPPFEIPKDWPRAYGVEVRWNTVAVVWGALDLESDVLYLYREYLGDAEPPVHAHAIRSRGGQIEGIIDREANGRSRTDDYGLIQIYRELGLHWRAVAIPIESGILEVWQRLRTGRLKVFHSLSNYLEERRHYRRDDKGQPVADQDALQNATRCLVTGAIPKMRIPPVDPSPALCHPAYRRDGLSWMY